MPVYVSLLIYREKQSKKIITLLHTLGLSINYHQVIKLQKQISSTLCEHCEKEGVVVPRILQNTWTTAAIDNIDFDGSSNTGNNAFNGTSISFHQPPSESSLEPPTFSLSEQQYKIELPQSYSFIDTMNSVNMKVSAPAKRITSA